MRTRRILLLGLAGAAIVLSVPAQVQRAKLTASTAAEQDWFGWSVAISGDWAIVGAPLDDAVAGQSGAAFMITRTGPGWVETQKLKASDAAFGNAFGWSVAIAGDVAVVGAHHNYPLGIYDAGAAYVFERVGSQWSQTAKIWASDAQPEMHFGNAVAVSGNRVLVGAADDSIFGLSSGSAYVFEKIGSSWVQTAKLVPSDGAWGDTFGADVSLAGDTALIGANGVDSPPGSDSNHGAAYVFQRRLSGWVQVTKLTASDGAFADSFGGSVDIDGNTVIIGATGHDAAASNAGAAYVFQVMPSGWKEVQKLLPSDPHPQGLFGGVTISGDLAVVSSHTDNDNGVNSGSVYAFRRSGSTWLQIGKLLPLDGTAFDLFGSRPSISGTLVLAGAHRDDDACPTNPICDSGSAYVFELAPDALQYGHCATGAPCGNLDDHGGCKNSTNHGAVLAAAGSGSVTLDELVLQATKLPPGVNGLFFRGGGQASTPYGDGIIGISSGGLGIYRYPVQPASAQGVMDLGPGLVAFSQSQPPGAQIVPGQTWSFQCWYRNPGGPCGSNFNFSSGVQATFVP